MKDNQPFDLKEPTGVAIDRFGHIFVADRAGMKIEMFAMNGLHLNSISLTHSAVGIHIDQDSDTLYAANPIGRVIYVYKL